MLAKIVDLLLAKSNSHDLKNCRVLASGKFSEEELCEIESYFQANVRTLSPKRLRRLLDASSAALQIHRGGPQHEKIEEIYFMALREYQSRGRKAMIH